MKLAIRIVSIVCMFLFSSCQKEVTGELEPNTGNNTGGSTTNDDYMPSTAGSEWNYSSTIQGNFTVKALGTDTMINGTKYYAYLRTDSGGTRTMYLSKTGGLYTSYGYFSPSGTVISFIELKDAAIGTTWTNTIGFGMYNNYHKLTVVAKGIQHTVLSKTFSNVIAMDYAMSGDDPAGGSALEFGGGKRFYAKGVGPIESYMNTVSFGITLSDTTRLISYSIK